MPTDFNIGDLFLIDDSMDLIYRARAGQSTWDTTTISSSVLNFPRGMGVTPTGELVVYNAFPLQARVYDGSWGDAVSMGPVGAVAGGAIGNDGTWWAVDTGRKKLYRRYAGVWEAASAGIAYDSSWRIFGMALDPLGRPLIVDYFDGVRLYDTGAWQAAVALPAGAGNPAGLTASDTHWIVLTTNGIYYYNPTTAQWGAPANMPTALPAGSLSPTALALYAQSPPVRLSASDDGHIGGASGLIVAPAVRLSASSDGGIGGSSGLVVAPPVRLAAAGDGQIGGQSALMVTAPPRVRLAASGDGGIGGVVTELVIRPPPRVRLAASGDGQIAGNAVIAVGPTIRMTAAGDGQIGGTTSGLIVTPGVRLAASGDGQISGESVLIVTPPPRVRLAAQGDGGISGASALIVAPAVRLAASGDGQIGGASELIVGLRVRLAASGDGGIGASANLSVTPPPRVRLAAQGDGGISGASGLIVAPAIRLVVRGDGRIGGSSSLLVILPPGVRLRASGLGVIGAYARLRVQEGIADPVQHARSQARSLQGEVSVFALEITHPRLQMPARVINYSQPVFIDGERYNRCAFTAEEPQVIEGEVPRASIRIDNVGRDLNEVVEATQGGRGAMMRVMRVVIDEALNAQVIWENPALSVGITEQTNQAIEISLVYRTGRLRPAIKIRHDPVTSPGVF